jgi:hypothetical protein
MPVPSLCSPQGAMSSALHRVDEAEMAKCAEFIALPLGLIGIIGIRVVEFQKSSEARQICCEFVLVRANASTPDLFGGSLGGRIR